MIKTLKVYLYNGPGFARITITKQRLLCFYRLQLKLRRADLITVLQYHSL